MRVCGCKISAQEVRLASANAPAVVTDTRPKFRQTLGKVSIKCRIFRGTDANAVARQ